MVSTVQGKHPIALSQCRRLGNNLSGQYKRGVGMALQIGIGNFSGAIASNIYRTQDSPRFILGRTLFMFIITRVLSDTWLEDGLEFLFIGIGLACVPIAVFSYRKINRERDALERSGEGPKYSPEELRRMGDRAPDFRYTL